MANYSQIHNRTNRKQIVYNIQEAYKAAADVLRKNPQAYLAAKITVTHVGRGEFTVESITGVKAKELIAAFNKAGAWTGLPEKTGYMLMMAIKEVNASVLFGNEYGGLIPNCRNFNSMPKDAGYVFINPPG